MELIRPCEAYLDSYREAYALDQNMLTHPDRILAKARRYETGEGLPEGRVRSTHFWLVEDGRFIGQINLRHSLTPALERYSGHIGYVVRADQQKKGYGTQLLAMALPYARDVLGLERVLLTCDDDNPASFRVMEKNGGVLENKEWHEEGEKRTLIRRYWIELK